MSPGEIEAAVREACFPRVSGDEPTLGSIASPEAAFSPRERG